MRFRSKSHLPPTHNQGVLGSSPSGTTSKNYQIKKIAENQIFQRFFFYPFPSKIGKIMKYAEYNSGTVCIKFNREVRQILIEKCIVS